MTVDWASGERTSVGVEDEGRAGALGAHAINDALRKGQAPLCKLGRGQQAGPRVKQLHHLPHTIPTAVMDRPRSQGMAPKRDYTCTSSVLAY